MRSSQSQLKRIFWIITICLLGADRCVSADDQQEFDELSKRAKAIASQKNPQAILELIDRLQTLAERLDARTSKPRFNRQVVGFQLQAAGIGAMLVGHYADSEAIHTRSRAILEAATGPESEDVASSLMWLAMNYHDWSRHADAEKTALRFGRTAKLKGKEDLDVATCLFILGDTYVGLGRYAESEQVHGRVLAIREKTLGPEHFEVADSLNHLAIIYRELGRYERAENMYKRALGIRERARGPETQDRAWKMDAASGMSNLAGLYQDQGRYAETEAMYKRVLAIREEAAGPDHPVVAESLNNLGTLHRAQGRYAEAEAEHKRALAIWEKAFGPDSVVIAKSLSNLGVVAWDQDRYAEAEALHKRALAIREKALGRDHREVAASLNNLAVVYQDDGRYAAAEPLHKRALAIREKTLGPDHPDTAVSLNNLADMYQHQGRCAEAEPLLDRAIAILDRTGVAPADRFQTFDLRAQISWRLGRRGEAISNLRHALDLAEEQRGRSAGTEQERATAFVMFACAYERMVNWRTELGDHGEAFQAMERDRARSLLEQLDLGAVDLLAGLPPDTAAELRSRESNARARIAELEARLRLPVQQSGVSTETRDALLAQLGPARTNYIEAYRDIRNASPAYRLNLSKDRKSLTMPVLHDWAKVHDALVLEYLLGDEGGFVLIVSADSEPRIEKLVLTSAQAGTLGVDAGPITSSRMNSVLNNGKGTAILSRITSPGSDSSPIAQLAALWQALVPQPERKALQEGRVKRLVVLPDAALALLPFEALVAEEGKEPKFLLDAGPPILYAPSATVFYNLAERPTGKLSADREPVLAVGDPAYGQTGVENPAPATALAALTSRSRYSSEGGRLSRLPHSGLEAQWVVKRFNDAGISAASFSGASATERGVRYWAPGRKLLHLACHGLADQQYGNFFGALALTPGPSAAEKSDDDGFLTLAEIYELNLKGTELTILSACQTNYGPQQKGEGTWALSRGFLVAGSRRVVASNWLVDDEAAASLVSIFCGGLAQAEKAGKPVDHAAALQAAKRYIRQQEKWKSPYYWASMVLIGPP